MVIKVVLVKPKIHPQEFRLMAAITVTINWDATTWDIWQKFWNDSEEQAAAIFRVCLIFLTLKTAAVIHDWNQLPKSDKGL